MTKRSGTSIGDDPATPYLAGNDAPVLAEVEEHHLPVTGKIPKELCGRYVRNGPNPRQPTDHWFTGDGMVHGVRIQDGRAQWYRNRYIRTESFKAPFPLYAPDGSRNLHASVANTHVVRHAGRILALVESSLPYEITSDLDTVGCFDFDGRLTNSMTAHPKICPHTGELHFFGYGNLREPYVTYHRADKRGTLVVQQPIDVPGLTMMHDFGLTEDHVIFLDLPVVFRMDLARSRASLPYRWSDEYGARIGIMQRATPAAPIQWFEINPCYVFHLANTFQRGDSVVITGIRYDELWRSSSKLETPSTLWQWTIDLATGRVDERQLDDLDCEYPRIDDSRVGSPAQFAYCAAAHSIIRYDLGTGSASTHDFGRAQPGEATFVPAAPHDAETDGYLLSYVYGPQSGTSDLVILDASDLKAPPLASIHLPQRVPTGFHGNWFAD